MSEERMEILRMLSDGIIDVDGAERLLKALEEGARRRPGDRPPSRPSRGMMESIMDTVHEALSGIGPAIREVVCEVGGAGDPDDYGVDPSYGPEVGIPEGSFEVPAGARLAVRSVGRKPAGSISIRGGGESAAKVAPGADFKVFGEGDSFHVLHRGGDLVMTVPQTLERLSVRSRSGPVSVENVAAEVDLKSLGGDVSLSRPGGSVNVKAMGGGVSIILGGEPGGDCVVASFGGNVSIEAPEGGMPPAIDLSTIGGAISGELPVPVSRRHGRDSAVSGAGSPLLKVRTHGGNIRFTRRRDG